MKTDYVRSAMDHLSLLRNQGYVILRQVFDDKALGQLRSTVTTLANRDAEAVRQRQGGVYAARNLLELCPEVVTLWRVPVLTRFVRETLGEQAGLVRGLYFDKPPQQTWALPWHKDVKIAVRTPSKESERYSKIRPRVGVPHCEPPVEVLERMLTLRIHLDAATEENGPLQVLPGSHHTGKTLDITRFDPVPILTAAGDVLAMRPLLAHCSGQSAECTPQHRRVVHLEFAASATLPDEYTWHAFHTLG